MPQPIDGVFLFRHDGDAHFELRLSRWGRLHAVWVVARSCPEEFAAADEVVRLVLADQVRAFFATCERAGLWTWSGNYAAEVADGAPWYLAAGDGTHQMSCRGNGSVHVPPGFSAVTDAMNTLTGGELYTSETWRWGHDQGESGHSQEPAAQRIHPALLLAAQAMAHQSQPPQQRPTIVCIAFILAAVVALLTGAIAALGLGVERRVEQQFFGVLLGGGLFLLVLAAAAILRIFGIRFFHD